LGKAIHQFPILWILWLAFFISNPLKINCQNNQSEELPAIEEIPVSIRIESVGAGMMNSLYEYESEKLFLPVLELFRFLQIKAEPSVTLDSISGFIGKEEYRYLIDNHYKKIFFRGKDFSIAENQSMNTGDDLYIDSRLFGEIFGLHCKFNFRNLSVTIKPDFELPVIRKMRIEQFRKNIKQLRGEVEADTTLKHQHELWKFGMMDWAATSTQSTDSKTSSQFWLRTGAEALYGETNLQLYYSSLNEFTNRNLQYYWRWVDNQNKVIRQVRAGRISPMSISSIYNPITGISITNASTLYRRSFGEYTISDYTEPGWTVELYVNNVIVDYQIADASGFYKFNIPLVYGASEVMLKFYGPYGEERIQRIFLNVPFSFLPPGELEYTVNSGLVLDDKNSHFERADVKYGVKRYLTIGGGFEYLSSIVSGKEIPFINASVAPVRNLLISSEYAKGVQTKLLANYRLVSGSSFELKYTHYVPGQQAVRVSYLEDWQATLSMPVRFPKFSAYSRLSYRRNVYKTTTYNIASITLSSYIKKLNASISAYANWMDGDDPFIYANIGLGLPQWKGFTSRVQSQINFSDNRVISLRAEIEKRILQQGYLSLMGEENFQSKYRAISLSFRWTVPFSQVNLATRLSNNEFMITEGAQGSFAFGSGKGYVHAEDRPSVGMGGLSIISFIDLNHNYKRDSGERLVKGLAMRINGGRVIQGEKDSIIRVVGLIPYTDYILTIDEKSLEEISYRIAHKVIRIYAEPNQFKKIEIPVLPMGEINGWVLRKDGTGQRGEGHIIIDIYSSIGKKIASTITERDGAFSYLGLPPGHYIARLDSAQVAKLGIVSSPSEIPFEIKPDVLGDVVYDLNFFVERPPTEDKKITETPKDTLKVTEIRIPLVQEFYTLQTGAFKHKHNAEQLSETLKRTFELPVWIKYENKLYKVRIGRFSDYIEAKNFRSMLREKGFDAFIIEKKSNN